MFPCEMNKFDIFITFPEPSLTKLMERLRFNSGPVTAVDQHWGWLESVEAEYKTIGRVYLVRIQKSTEDNAVNHIFIL